MKPRTLSHRGAWRLEEIRQALGFETVVQARHFKKMLQCARPWHEAETLEIAARMYLKDYRGVRYIPGVAGVIVGCYAVRGDDPAQREKTVVWNGNQEHWIIAQVDWVIENFLSGNERRQS